MKIYMAPMEGITGHIYRKAYHKNFGDVDKYYTPFISPTENKYFTTRELNEILPENNAGMNTVPQILCANSSHFVKAYRNIAEFGYEEVNLNLGCPSKTVVSKSKGSGFLRDLEKLDKFLYEVFEQIGDNKISIKTRSGFSSHDEFYSILEVYNKYKLTELIIHPRIQADLYKNEPSLEDFAYAVKESKNVLCYNGDIKTLKDYEKISTMFDTIPAVMLGRGLIGNPVLVSKIRELDNTDKIASCEQVSDEREKMILSRDDRAKIKSFLDDLCAGYEDMAFGGKNVLFKLKEVWFYLFDNVCDDDKIRKRLRKTESLSEYKDIVNQIFG